MEELEFMLFKEEKSDIQSEWDKQTPIVSKGKVVTVFLNDEIYEPGAYNELCYTLENTVADEVRLYMNNGGGQLDSMLSIIASMERCGCEITGVLSGTVASAATMIALQCDKLEVADYTSWLTHYYSGGTGGKGNEIKAKHDFESIEIPKLFKQIHKDFLTPSEITRVIDGKDIWLNKDQILERFARMKDAK
jgi:ATP-dependent protease ClpP protease subunit